MEDNRTSSRRKFIKTSGAIAGITVIPSKSVWGACNASGVSGGSQALESVCQVSSQDDPENKVSLGGFPASDFQNLFTAVNRGGLPNLSARGTAGKMFTKSSWLDASVPHRVNNFDFPVFRYNGNGTSTNLIHANGQVQNTPVKNKLNSLDGAKKNKVNNVDPHLIKGVLNSNTDWHMSELLAVRGKLETLANEKLTYVSGVGSNGKAVQASFNVLDELKTGRGPVLLQISALYLNLIAGFSSGVPLGYTVKQYCEHLVSIMLENATSPGFATDLTVKVSSRFSAPKALEASSFLSAN